MANSAVGGVEKCLVCDREYNSLDPSSRSPTCSDLCWQILTEVLDHKGLLCWIPGCLEVSCTIGYCNRCQIFKMEEEIKKRGLEKDKLIGDY